MEGESLGAWPEFPFCSEKCRLIDLGRWLGGRYGVPVGSDVAGVDDLGADDDAP
jgi:hypothetical protein